MGENTYENEMGHLPSVGEDNATVEEERHNTMQAVEELAARVTYLMGRIETLQPPGADLPGTTDNAIVPVL